MSTTDIQEKIEEAKAKLEAAKPKGKEPQKAPYKPAPKNDVVSYLEGRVSALEEENRQLKELLLLYGEHAAALWNLTTGIFTKQEPEEVADNVGGA